MLDGIKKWFRELVTEGDNRTHCIARWMGLTCFSNFMLDHVHDVYMLGHPFDPVSYAKGVALILAGTAAFVGVKMATGGDSGGPQSGEGE